MRILVVNDDGISATGISHLAKMAAGLGEVWVVAPDQQCSAMSHKITVYGTLEVKQFDFSEASVHAYGVSGTPADCVKVGVKYLMEHKPDIVFSGVNYGYNVGLDILYSGTVAAAMEALLHGIPAIAFSKEMDDNYDVVDANILSITKDLLSRPIQKNEIWNVNFPGCTMSDYRGVLYDRIPAQTQFYLDNYERSAIENNDFRLTINGRRVTDAEEGTDMRAVLDNYISVGKVRSSILRA
ncbi:MAG: 5'/3'-nucleotidase SurE [Clostridiales bacterium]|jgi:5'-nucleotidase|nr:5'/3'-nucleotidase SurE [Bacillota bacterium]NLK04056.1 5'/3'-nucleotidase SurE [Clostridiales bacterium]